jgi:hypothetical protein
VRQVGHLPELHEDALSEKQNLKKFQLSLIGRAKKIFEKYPRKTHSSFLPNAPQFRAVPYMTHVVEKASFNGLIK